MTEASDIIESYLQIRRVISAICLANGDLSHEERVILASSIGGASNLTSDQIKILIKDSEDSPDIKQLVKDIKFSGQIKQLLVDLSALAVIKVDWHSTEIVAAHEAIEALPLEESAREGFVKAFDLLRNISQALE